MNSLSRPARRNRRGSAAMISMFFILVFSALTVSMVSLSDSSVQISANQRKVNQSRAAAESGLEIIRYWLSRVSLSGSTPGSEVFTEVAESFQADLTTNGISNVAASYSGSVIVIPQVTLDSSRGQSFSASITRLDDDTVQADVTGMHGEITRTLRINYRLGERANTVFNFGVATKGPLALAGNIELEGINVSVEASVYIESENSNVALSITGNSQIAGDVAIVNSTATVEMQGGQASIGGETGDDAIENHVSFGVPPSEFPEPDPGYFLPFVMNTIDANTDTTADAVYENIIIPAGTNPTFSGHVTLKGVVYIEQPNVVTFSGTTDIIGVIVGNGDSQDNSGTNQIKFMGTVHSEPINTLPPEPQFVGLRDQFGTFIVAPGFELSFGGAFDTLNGAIASNGVKFYGDAGGIINGSIINYSDEPMVLSGNSDLYFNRSGTSNVPPGFIPDVVLYYEAASYSEVLL